MSEKQVLLDVQDLKVYYPGKRSPFLNRVLTASKAVDGVSFQIYRGETFGLVGESGCGKSTTGKAIVRLNKATGGAIYFEGEKVSRRLPEKERMAFSRKVQFIFQDPYSSLDPRFTVQRCIAEPMVIHKMGTAAQRRERVGQLMHEVGLREDQATRYPREFSGGQRQRIGIARALAVNPSLIVCDEPVSALDVSIQAQILNLMQELQAKHNLTYLFISHNLSVVKHICDRVAVMYLGHIVEIARTDDLFEHPMHPYTQALLGAIPIPDPELGMTATPLEGDVPSPLNPPSGCCFHTRCKYAQKGCSCQLPVLKEVRPGHFVACHMTEKENCHGAN